MMDFHPLELRRLFHVSSHISMHLSAPLRNKSVTSLPCELTILALPLRTEKPSPPIISEGNRGIVRPPATSGQKGNSIFILCHFVRIRMNRMNNLPIIADSFSNQAGAYQDFHAIPICKRNVNNPCRSCNFEMHLLSVYQLVF